MATQRIKVTADVRKLLVELDAAYQTFHALTGKLADRDNPISNSEAMDLGAERERVKSMILGISYRMNKASRGEQ